MSSKIAMQFVYRSFRVALSIFIYKTMCNLFPSKIVYGRWIVFYGFTDFVTQNLLVWNSGVYNKAKVVFMCKRHDIYFQTEHNKNTHQSETNTMAHKNGSSTNEFNECQLKFECTLTIQVHTFRYRVEYVKLYDASWILNFLVHISI